MCLCQFEFEMLIDSISAVFFRNIENLSLKLSPGINVFFGNNAQGKTNILEAIHSAITSKSFRTTDFNHFVNHGNSNTLHQASVMLRCCSDSLTNEISLKILNRKKIYCFNGKKISRKNRPLDCVVIHPDSLVSIKKGSEAKRNFLDDMICNHDFKGYEILKEYKKILTQRNALFKNYKEKKISNLEFKNSLKSIDSLFLDSVCKVSSHRIRYLNCVLEPFRKVFSELMGRKQKTDLRYVISGKDVTDASLEDLRSLFLSQIKEKQELEPVIGYSLWGAHKHDFTVSVNCHDARFYSSQGQQKILILALKIAQILHYKTSWDKYPILLLDDIHSELDSSVRCALMGFLNNLPTQIFITTTSINFLEGLKKCDNIVRVVNGKVESSQPPHCPTVSH